jgi:phosphatidylglycerol:prolipoprotein diacylglycerol transferase
VRFASGPRLDLGLLEALLTLALLVIAEAARRAGRDRPGAIAAVIAMGYALIRFPLDFLRAEELSGGDPRYAGFTAAQWGCLPLFGLGLVALALAASAPLSAAIATAGASSQGQPKSNHQR